MSSIDEKIKGKSDEIEKILNKWGFVSVITRDKKKSDIQKWFFNFKPSEFDDAFLIFSNIQYYDDHIIRNYIETLSKELKKVFRDEFSAIKFFPLGESPSSSGGNFLYYFRKELGLPESSFPYSSFKDITLSDVNAIVFFDDVIGSGNQALKFAKEHLEKVDIDKYYVALVAFEDGFKKIKDDACFKKVICHTFLSEEFKAFSPVSQFFPEDETRQRLEKMCKKYGEYLYPKHPLGYDDSQALIVFPHNTPNNTLPIIWASDKNEKEPGKIWYPLWERKKEVRGYKSSASVDLKEYKEKEYKQHSYEKINNSEKKEREISDFFEKINQSKSDYSGALIDRIFIPPDEYSELKEKLKNDKIIFITGTTGYGKTYTSIRLLWEWYKIGYIPKWISGKEPSDRIGVREKLANIDIELIPNHIIYFEDPFGKTKYESRDDLKERINSIINSVKNKKDVYVIITSRKDVFEEFDSESYSVEEIKNFKEELQIIKPSYGYNKRKKILKKWAEEKGCEWLVNEELKTIVYESLKDTKILATPLSIHDFVEATVNVKDEKCLQEKTNEYSKLVEMAFADEIKGFCHYGREDRILFLSLIFVLRSFEVEFVKQEYNKLKKEGNKDFDDILKEEYRVRVIWEGSNEILIFSHPSYSGALQYILDQSLCKNIFCAVLKELSQYDFVGEHVASVISDNFDKLPKNLSNELLLNLSENKKLAVNIAKIILLNSNGVSHKVRKLLFDLSEDDNIASIVIWTMVFDFDKISDDLRNELLFKYSENNKVSPAVARVLADNFDKFPEYVRNELCVKLSEKDEAAWHVAKIVENNFDKFSENVRNGLLLKLSKKD